MENKLGKTALYICAGRAMETIDRPESEWLFEDKYAKEISGDYGFEFMKIVAQLLPKKLDEKTRIRMLADSVSIRTKYIDDIIKKHQHDIKQYVFFGIGGDSRSYRLIDKDSIVFEIDLPEVIDYRVAVFNRLNAKPNCDLKTIKCDITNMAQWVNQLKELGFNKDKKTLFLIEGVLMYLKQEDCEKLLENISRLSVKDSLLVGDMLSEAHLTSESTNPLRALWKEWGSEVVTGCTYPEKMIDKYNFITTVDAFGSTKAYFGRIDKDSLAFYQKYSRGCPEEEAIPRNLFFWSIKTTDH